VVKEIENWYLINCSCIKTRKRDNLHKDLPIDIVLVSCQWSKLIDFIDMKEEISSRIIADLHILSNTIS